jgi:lipopolysaccharide biosynthesis regulator YciM
MPTGRQLANRDLVGEDRYECLGCGARRDTLKWAIYCCAPWSAGEKAVYDHQNDLEVPAV